MHTFERLRQEYPVFSFDGFSVDAEDGNLRVTYAFTQSEEIRFHPSWVFPVPYETWKNDRFLQSLLFSLGLAELVSYWKACCSPVVEIRCGTLTEEQTRWWKKLWYHGLGEFFYRNGITADEESFVAVRSSGQVYRAEAQHPSGGELICVGGGKDSCVTMALLRGRGARLFCVNGSAAIFRTAEAAGYTRSDFDVFRRRLDCRIVELNAAGYLNGHTPFSSVLAFSALVDAYVRNLRYIVLSNESSANDVYVKGTEVNHQYSKSFAFENDFRRYVRRFLPCGIEYFSLLRPLNEWNIVKRFVREPAFLDAFRSCNLGAKDDCWCCACPKCLFTYILLSAFLDRDRVCRIFGKNLLDDPAMLPYLDGLVCEDFDKPFECIGTRQETAAALRAAIRRNGTGQLLLREYQRRYGSAEVDERAVDTFWDDNNNVPSVFLEVLSCDRN